MEKIELSIEVDQNQAHVRAGYTRVVGQIFNPSVALILVLKIALFSFAVGIIPLASSFYEAAGIPSVVFGVVLIVVRVLLPTGVTQARTAICPSPMSDGTDHTQVAVPWPLVVTVRARSRPERPWRTRRCRHTSGTRS